APVERFGTRVIGIALGTLVAASVAALLLSNALLRPIRAMQVAAKRYGRGELDVRLPETRWDELGELAHEFNQMAGSLAEKEQELRSYAQTLEQKVQERTQKLQTTISQLQRAEQIGQLGSWEWDVPGDHMIVSDGLAQLVGTSPESLGSTLDAYFERIHPGDLERMQQTLANSLQKAGPFEAETRFIRADGQVRTFHARGESAFDADGNPARLIGVVIDITERKQAETQINELLEFNEKVLNMVPVGMLTFEISGQCTYANENAASIIGARVEALMAQNFRELESWKRSGLFSLAEKAIAGKVHVVADIHHVSTFGRDVWLRASAVTFSSRDREQLLLTISDITERKLAEEAIRESEDKFRYLFDHSIIGKSITFPDGTMDVNDAFCAMIGYPKSDLKSKNWREITHPDDVRASEEAIAPLLAREADSTRFTKRYLHSNGSIVWADVNTVLRRDPDGKPVYFLTALLDITERKEAEEALQRLTEDLRRSNAELEQFAYVASHDLQEPLRMISSYMHLLSDRYTGRLDSDADEFIQYAVDGATRMQNLINDLLAYSRVGTRGKEHIPVSMENVLKDALANLEFAIEENGARITHEALPLICGDPLQLVMVLQNLIGNAIKFRGAESPRIHMDARRQGGEWLFSISDNGIGFDQKFAERVFVIFQRLHTRGAYPGTGIGLAICKRIILRHGGRIWVESQRGQGSVFNFTLPALEAA
ncbi:MAG TPA: PAS domain S-box protein, partial [Anaerolineales bacterium]|nr:PAS domain S-box protein [Anaerolineales bacterium]